MHQSGVIWCIWLVKKKIQRVRLGRLLVFLKGVILRLKELHLKKKVSVAWVVRDAVETYLKDKKERINAKNV